MEYSAAQRQAAIVGCMMRSQRSRDAVKNPRSRGTQYETTLPGIVKLYADDVDADGLRALLSMVDNGSTLEVYATLEAGWRFMRRWEGSGKVVSRTEPLVCLEPASQDDQEPTPFRSTRACWLVLADLGSVREGDRDVVRGFLDRVDDAGDEVRWLVCERNSTVLRHRQGDTAELWQLFLG